MNENTLSFTYSSTSFLHTGILDGKGTFILVLAILVSMFVASYIGYTYWSIYRLLVRERREKQEKKRALKEMILMKEIQDELDREIDNRLQQTIINDTLRSDE